MIKSRLKILLAERDMTLRDLSRATGMHYTSINRFEKDGRTFIARGTLDAVCKALNVQPGDIFVYLPEETEELPEARGAAA